MLLELRRVRKLVDKLEAAIEASTFSIDPRNPRQLPSYDNEMALIVAEVANAFDLPIDDVMGTRQLAFLVSARTAFAVAAHRLGASYSQIGRFLGRHHTTIMPLVKNYPTRLVAYPEHKHAMQVVVEKFKP